MNAHCGLGSIPGPRPSEGRRSKAIALSRLSARERGDEGAPWAFETAVPSSGPVALNAQRSGSRRARPLSAAPPCFPAHALSVVPSPFGPADRSIAFERHRRLPTGDSARSRASGPGRHSCPRDGYRALRKRSATISSRRTRERGNRVGSKAVGVEQLGSLLSPFPFLQKKNGIFSFPTSDRTRLPAEFKHITKRRKRN